MLSFQSLIFTIVAVIAIWKAFSFLSKFNKGTGTAATKSPPPGQPPQQRSVNKSIELVPCTRCGAYVDPKEGCHCTTSGT